MDDCGSPEWAWRASCGRSRRIKMDSALNKPFKQWNEVFPNAACIVTMLDRLLHHAEVTVIEGSSYRMRESELESLERRRSKS